MKRCPRIFLSALFLAMLFIVPSAFAQSASGAFHASTDDGARDVEFHAMIHPNGSASGEIKFSGPLSIPDQDVDGDGTGDVVPETTVSLRVDVDCVNVVGNRAAIAGKVKDSNVGVYVGRQIILTVEDGGEGNNADPDRFTWGQYNPMAATWIASDAELEVDPGVGLIWFASDFEREDDVPVLSTPATGIDCRSFPLGSYSLVDLPQGTGNIQVKP